MKNNFYSIRTRKSATDGISSDNKPIENDEQEFAKPLAIENTCKCVYLCIYIVYIYICRHVPMYVCTHIYL